MTGVRPRGRAMLVYATPEALAEARSVVREGVVVEQEVAAAIQAGLRRRIDGVDVVLADDERLARPLGASWVAVVARGRGRLVPNRPRSCWWIRRVLPVAAGAVEVRPTGISAEGSGRG